MPTQNVRTGSGLDGTGSCKHSRCAVIILGLEMAAKKKKPVYQRSLAERAKSAEYHWNKSRKRKRLASIAAVQELRFSKKFARSMLAENLADCREHALRRIDTASTAAEKILERWSAIRSHVDDENVPLYALEMEARDA